MVVKKRAKKKGKIVVTSKKNSVKLKTPRTRSNFSIVVKNLLLFVILAVASFVLYKYVIQNYFLVSLFYVTSMIFGFMAVGFFITFLILIVIKLIKALSGKRISKPVSFKKNKKVKRKKEVKYTLVQ